MCSVVRASFQNRIIPFWAHVQTQGPIFRRNRVYVCYVTAHWVGDLSIYTRSSSVHKGVNVSLLPLDPKSPFNDVLCSFWTIHYRMYRERGDNSYCYTVFLPFCHILYFILVYFLLRLFLIPSCDTCCNLFFDILNNSSNSKAI